MPVQWMKYLWDGARPVTSDELERLEHRWGVRLPEEYKHTVTAHQGMTPTPGVFNVGRGTNVISVLLTVSDVGERNDYSVLSAFETLKPLVPEGLYPFAETPGGEYVCFDYRAAREQPRVVLVTTGADIHPIADSFSEFLDKLHG